MARAARLALLASAAVLASGSLAATSLGAATAASTAPGATRVDHDHDLGKMVDPYAPAPRAAAASGRATWRARTVTVSPAAGPNFQLPFRCGEAWVGSTRNSHSPSRWSIDFNRTGDTGRAALSSARGVVNRSARASGYGNYVIVDHGRGYSTLYAHLQSSNVAVGQVVDQGSVVGYVGGTGRVTGPHLHFEMRLNGNYFQPYFQRRPFAYNRTTASSNCASVPLTGDWDGNKVTDLGILQPTAGRAAYQQLLGARATAISYGLAGDLPVIGDWNGNRIDQLGRRPVKTRMFELRGEAGQVSAAYLGGTAMAVPVSGKWVAGAKSGLGIYDNATRRFMVRLPNLTKRTITYGARGTQPVVGDWDGNGVTDFGSFNPVTGLWQLRSATGVTSNVAYGGNWDIPVTGDWDGDRITDLGVWRPSTATFYQRTVLNRGTPQARVVSKVVRMGTPR